MPKEDPETTALKKELTDLIDKVKVNKTFKINVALYLFYKSK